MLFPSLAKSLTLALLATNAVVSALPMASHDDDDDSSSLTTTTKSTKTKSTKTKTTSTDDYTATSSLDDDSDSDATSTKSTKTKTSKGSKATSTAAKASTAAAVAAATGSSAASSSSSGTSSSGSGVSGSVFGYASLNGGTTGGSSGSSVTATSLDELTSYCAQDGALTIYVSGALTGSGDTVPVSADKSVIGKSGASLTNIGLSISGVSNVIIQNLSISKVVGTDAVRVQKSTNVWLDHLDLSSDQDHALKILDT
ncbi:unnamed protein product [Ambrosiozyma monospora]|uniref:Unnamed protein product n=1 Tax=Ambrosiozyma monospora TaxID=43982 RepID=A0ACB5TBL5_AMBMO|nr:unnamed protein product [Ambrosiozyma monospora]